jgi:hypothetical protein
VDMVGSNNAMIIFLSLNTLTDDAGNLWNMNGKDPAGLDILHNVAFTPAADIAILLGDVYGDGTFTNFNMYEPSGFQFGQGVFYLQSAFSNFYPFTAARLSQFDGTGTNACASNWDSGSRLMTRWECALPWASINAPAGIQSISNCAISGLILSSSTNGNDRYISGKYLGLPTTSGTLDEYGSFGFNFVILNGIPVSAPSGDFNTNDIPDEWERYYFGQDYVPTRDSDFDGDGFLDTEEYLAGTNPKDLVSLLEADAVFPNPLGPGFVIHWPSVEGKVYSVFRGTNLLNDSFTAIANGVPATPPLNVYTDAVAGAECRFYRVRTGR